MSPEGTERRLAAILHADVVGYSRLMAEDEDATVRLVTAYREEVELLVRQHRGQLVDFTGDNFLVEFRSAVAAVECATEIQDVLKARNARHPEERRMQFRMGVHLGEVRVEGERLFGTGVNVAARIQALAESGGLCISREVHLQVEGKLNLSFEDLGEHQAKNIPEPLHVYAVDTPGAQPVPARRGYWIAGLSVLLAGAGLALWLADRPPKAPPAFDRSIAVFPFTTIGPTTALQSYANGLTEELRSVLTGYQELRTITGGQAPDAPPSGRPGWSNSSYVVNGNVQEVGEQLWIRVQLVRVTDRQSTWAQTYDVAEEELAADPSVLASTIGRFVRLQLVQDHQCETVRRKSRSAEAADLVCAAQAQSYRVNQRGGFDPPLWLSNAQRAIALDPNLAEGYRQITYACALLVGAGEMSWQEASKLSHAGLDEALEIDRNDPMTLWALALAEYRFDLDYQSAEARLRQAISLEPLHPNARWFHGSLGNLARRRGNITAALDHYRRAIRIYDADGRIASEYADSLYLAGEDRLAVDAANAGLNLVSDGVYFLRLSAVKIQALLALGEQTDAEAALDDLQATLGPESKRSIADLVASVGRIEEARQMVKELENLEKPSPRTMTLAYATLGDYDRAFRWVHRAVEEHAAVVLQSLRLDTTFTAMRGDPRWEEVIRHLEEEEARGRRGPSGS